MSFFAEAHPVDPGALACCSVKEEDWTMSLADQVSLIIDPTTTWNNHKGYISKKDKKQDISQDCQESEEKKETNNLLSPDDGGDDDEDSDDERHLYSKDLSEINAMSENIVTFPKSSSSPKDSEGGSIFEEIDEDIIGEENSKEIYDTNKKGKDAEVAIIDGNSIKVLTVENQLSSGENDANITENIQELLSSQNEVHQENLIENDDDIPRIIKQDNSPRFSSLSETVERGLGSNISGMEGAGITPSVSSSKYTTGSGIPRIVTEPKDSKTAKTFKKVFVLKDLKERLVTDLSTYRKFHYVC